ncbi:hypothetical protein BH09MYX1_BH09MYX1_05410 [soil metagenome]
MRYAGLLLGTIVVGFTALVACGSDDSSVFDPTGDGGLDGSANSDGNVTSCATACTAGEKCSSKGRCIPSGSCDGDADCSEGLKCDAPTSTCVPGGNCGSTAIAADPIPPNLLVVLDRSCSMTDVVGNQTKWQIAVDALKTLTTNYTGKIRFGLTMFPDTVNPTCAQSAIPTPVGPNNESKIQATLTSSLQKNDPNFPDGPCVTNIDTAMQQAATDPGFADVTRKSFAMLVTDGSQAGCNAGGGDPGTITAVTGMATKGVKTFVVGFGSGVDTPALDSFAVAGQVPASNVSPKFYNAGNKASLDKALATIASLTLSCTFKLGSVPPDPTKLFVFVDKKTQLTRDPNKLNGWDYDPVKNEVTVYGKTCDDFKAGVVKAVDVVYGCPSINPN